MIFFNLNEYSDIHNQENLKKLIALLGADERCIRIEENTLCIDDKKIKARLKRNAGAKRKEILLDDEIIGPTPIMLSDIEEMQKTMSDVEIYTKLGISKATFYRRLKKAKAEVFEDDNPGRNAEF